MVASATAQVALKTNAHFVFCWVWVFVQQTDSCHDHSGSAKAALQTMILHEGFLHRMHFSIGSKTFNGGDLRAIGLHCKNGAAFHCFAIEVELACATARCIATDVGASEAKVFTHILNEQSAWLNITFVSLTVNSDADLHGSPLRNSLVATPIMPQL